MYTLLNNQKEPIAYIENMMILDATKQSVIGIIIGDCFFGKKDHVIGKIFKDHAYLLNGEIVASVVRDPTYVSTAPTKEQTSKPLWTRQRGKRGERGEEGRRP